MPDELRRIADLSPMLHRTWPPCYAAAFTIPTRRVSVIATPSAIAATWRRNPVSRPSRPCLRGQTTCLSHGAVLCLAGEAIHASSAESVRSFRFGEVRDSANLATGKVRKTNDFLVTSLSVLFKPLTTSSLGPRTSSEPCLPSTKSKTCSRCRLAA